MPIAAYAAPCARYSVLLPGVWRQTAGLFSGACYVRATHRSNVHAHREVGQGPARELRRILDLLFTTTRVGKNHLRRRAR